MNSILSRITKKHLLIVAAAVVALLLILLFLTGRQSEPVPSSETADVRQRLESIENRDVAAVRTAIDSQTKESSKDTPSADLEQLTDSDGSADQEGSSEALPSEPDPSASGYFQIFSDSLFMGDSVIHDLDVYGLVPSSNIIAENGVSLEEVDEEIQLAASFAPRRIFLYYGFNDIGHVGDDYESFRYLYENLLIRLREALPDSMIYANSIFPVHDLDTLLNGWYADVSPYNDIIADLCTQYGIPYLDHSYLVSDEYYYDDGYHFIYEFYPLWLDAMAREAGLAE